MKFTAAAGRARRVAAGLGLAVALVSAMLVGVPAAHAAPSEPTRATDSGAAADRAARVQKAYRIQPDGSAQEVSPTTDFSAAATPYALILYPAYESDCFAREMCIWTGDYYSGYGVFMGGDYAWCQGWRFENTVFQDHTWSIWNRVTGGPSSIWNRFSDGSYRYTKYGLLQSGYKHATRFSLIMDAWAFDPANNCTSLNLAHI
ncbi:hypothetical protein Val02_31240 [Virgisporangium aliadipatigenens]|uniref:Peptidase inhibitor family I36 n=1 Tax=Virgisporangium aliadipatigenens TaxID=741659 RepID=A0A8J3YM22_9ACTN|nr:hypothetical protein [Virgisporangium aliadipatigenens]GIJ46238.1 hypothetical protein Val02_31240 [Virgisporangium aliadipatigenens]